MKVFTAWRILRLSAVAKPDELKDAIKLHMHGERQRLKK